jgi:hypothetical protein
VEALLRTEFLSPEGFLNREVLLYSGFLWTVVYLINISICLLHLTSVLPSPFLVICGARIKPFLVSFKTIIPTPKLPDHMQFLKHVFMTNAAMKAPLKGGVVLLSFLPFCLNLHRQGSQPWKRKRGGTNGQW